MVDESHTVLDNYVTVREAAVLLGVSESAIRKRVERDTLKHYKGEDGKLYVRLSPMRDMSSTHESHTLMSEMSARIESLERQLDRPKKKHG